MLVVDGDEGDFDLSGEGVSVFANARRPVASRIGHAQSSHTATRVHRPRLDLLVPRHRGHAVVRDLPSARYGLERPQSRPLGARWQSPHLDPLRWHELLAIHEIREFNSCQHALGDFFH